MRLLNCIIQWLFRSVRVCSIVLNVCVFNTVLRGHYPIVCGLCLVLKIMLLKIVTLWCLWQRLWISSFAWFSTSFCSALPYFRNCKAENYFSWKLSLLVIQGWFVFVIQIQLWKCGYGTELCKTGGWTWRIPYWRKCIQGSASQNDSLGRRERLGHAACSAHRSREALQPVACSCDFPSQRQS